MNKNKEVLLKILIASSIYTAILGFHSLVHKENFNEDKLKYDKKVKVVKLVKKDSFNTFMRKVKDGEIKRVAERKVKIEKQKQIELKRILVEKRKAKEKAERIREEKVRNEKLKEEKRIAKKHKSTGNITLSRGSYSSENTNYDTTFEITWYTDLNGSVTSSGQHVRSNGCASNTIPKGTHIKLEGFGEITVNDCGGSDLNSSNRLDMFLVRLQGESDRSYNERAVRLGRTEVRGRIIK